MYNEDLAAPAVTFVSAGAAFGPTGSDRLKDSGF